MGPFQVSVAEGVVSGVTLAALLGMWKMLRAFVREQREANEANRQANRSMQRDVLYRYFRVIVEEGRAVTPEEYAHVEECFNAYHANGGNGAGALMMEKIREHAVINTGREVIA